MRISIGADTAVRFTTPVIEGATGRSSSRKTILVVEDNELSMRLMRDILGSRGYEAISTSHGLEAIEIAGGLRPDLILLDIQLPDLSGFDVARRLKADAATRSIPVIAVTAFAMSGDRARSLESGCDGYLSKPINVMDFLAMVERSLSIG